MPVQLEQVNAGDDEGVTEAVLVAPGVAPKLSEEVSEGKWVMVPVDVPDVDPEIVFGLVLVAVPVDVIELE